MDLKPYKPCWTQYDLLNAINILAYMEIIPDATIPILNSLW